MSTSQAELLEVVLAGITEGVWIYDRDWRIIYANDRAVELTFYKREEMIGRSMWDLHPTMIGSEPWQLLHKCRDERVPVRWELYYEKYDIWYETRAYPVEPGVCMISADITEQKRAQQKLQTAQAYLRTAIDSLRAEFWISDVNGNVIMQNKRARENWGDYSGKSVRDTPGTAQQREEWLSRNEAITHRGEEVELDWNYDDGESIRYYHTAMMPIRGEGGKIIEVDGARACRWRCGRRRAGCRSGRRAAACA